MCPARFKCTQCSFDYASQKGLDKHIKAIHDENTYNCELCDYKAAEKHSLEQHNLTKHKGIMFDGRCITFRGCFWNLG